jgi:hypothetical protein
MRRRGSDLGALRREDDPVLRGLKWVAVLCVSFLIVAYAVTTPLNDFVEYWTSAHQLVAGRNPYSLPELFQLQLRLGWRESVPLMNLTPPWAMPLIAPVGLAKSYAIAWLAWVSVLVLALWWSTRLLIDLYSGGRSIFPSEPRGREPLIAFTFYPAVLCLRYAQITPFMLLGVAGFLWFEQRKRHALGGMCLGLATIKPHLLYLVWLAMLFRLLRKKDWVAATSLGSVAALFTLAATLMRPTVVRDYWALSRSGYAHIWPSALGAILRYPFGKVGTFPLQFVAPLAGAIWFVFYWRRRRDDWQWKENMPLLVAISLLTTAYGWAFDQVLLMLPIVAVAARFATAGEKLPRKLIIWYTSINIALFLLLRLQLSLEFALAPLAIMGVLLKFTPGESSVGLAPAYGSSDP